MSRLGSFRLGKLVEEVAVQWIRHAFRHVVGYALKTCDMCLDTCLDMCSDMWLDMCLDMWLDMCLDVAQLDPIIVVP